MTEHDAFLQAILDAPRTTMRAADVCRLADGRGDPRGEFIRLECELGSMDADDPRDRRWRHRPPG
jgi:hypothetical protein